jgi:hypothetical protein
MLRYRPLVEHVLMLHQVQELAERIVASSCTHVKLAYKHYPFCTTIKVYNTARI